jgi:hypothetical protein
VKLGLHPRYPLVRPRGLPDGAPMFTGASFGIAASFLLATAATLRPVRGSPTLRLLRRLRPVPARSADGGPSPTRHAGRVGAGRTRTVPVFTAIRSTKEEPSSAPAASPRLPRSTSPWPPGRHPHAGLGVPHRRHPACTATGAHRSRPLSARFEPVSL